jgi:coenzyme F420-reducing hydrogenase beta subunit
MSICPKNAILMSPDYKGFLYPQIDSELCIDCGLCKKVCPIQNKKANIYNFSEPDVYAVKHISDNVRMDSSSGGMFTAISDYVLGKQGVVYGAAYSDNFKVCHENATSKIERDRFLGSKYVQSDLKNCLQSIKADLQEGKYVLFSGTPCQVAGLKNFLSENEAKYLITTDIVCHGTPSPTIFADYLGSIESTYKSNIQKVNFRYKPLGWRATAINISLTDGCEYKALASDDPYYHLFLSNIILRDCCYQCVFTNLHRPSDITLGDFWGIEKSSPEFEDEKGVSLVLINTETGRQVFKDIRGDLDFRSSTIQDCMQQNLKEPSISSPKTEKFWGDYQKHGYTYVTKKFGKPSWKKEIKKTLISLGIFNLMKKLYK